MVYSHEEQAMEELRKRAFKYLLIEFQSDTPSWWDTSNVDAQCTPKDYNFAFVHESIPVDETAKISTPQGASSNPIVGVNINYFQRKNQKFN